MKSLRITNCCVIMSLLALFAVTLSSCSDDDYINAIPKESKLLMKVNTVKATGTGHQLILQQLLKTSKVSDYGIDLSRDVYLFEDAQSNFGVCAKVGDDDKLEDAISKVNIKVKEKKDCRYAALPSGWVICFNSKAALLMGPVLPAAQEELATQLSRYLNEDEDESIKDSPIYDKLDSIKAPISMVAEAQSLPQQIVTPFTVGAPKDADPSDIMIAAAMTLQKGRLMIKGETFSFKKRIDEALKKAKSVYRPIKGDYLAGMSKEDILGMFLNVDGKQFHDIIRQNRAITTMLAGINRAIDMDNILRSVDGDMAMTSPKIGDGSLRLKLAAKLSGAPWLADVDYWKQSVPSGGFIGDWGKNCFYYQGDGTSYYFGVTPDMQYMSGGSKEDALSSIKPSKTPIAKDLQQFIKGKKLVMVINFAAFKGTKAEVFVSLLRPLIGNAESIVYYMN